MLLHRFYLNLRCKQARRDLSDPYQMHATLCRAFSPPEQKCPAGEFLWRLEPETDSEGNPRILVQSRSMPDWFRIGTPNWFFQEPDPAINLRERLGLAILEKERRFRYRLRANPSVCSKGKRLGLFKREDQISWFSRKGELHGFTFETIHLSQESMTRGERNNGGVISVFSVLFDGVLKVKDPEKFRQVVDSGIGHGKALGLGLLSVIPVS